jgi:hypothetical protein
MRMKLIIVTKLLLLVSLVVAEAQFLIPRPVINTGAYAIRDTVYMDPAGDDMHTGTIDQPVKTFGRAVELLPFGEVGVGDGHAYGLVMLKPGFYETVNGWRQAVSQWKRGDTYRHVSLEGIGEVTIGGTKEQFAQNHLIILPGDHIFIKNIRLQYSSGIGILLSRSEPGEGRQSNVLIEDVEVDSVGSFAMLIRGVDTVLVRHCKSMYASIPGSENFTSPCQWPSGIKFFGSSECIIHDSEIAYTRGEGLNFHNSHRGEAYRNRIHDNPTNVYNDNSAAISLHHNLIYNTPGLDPKYWKTCPADAGPTWAGNGVLIANEGACDTGSLPVFENCATRCVLPDEVFLNVDSMYVYNNILLNTGSAFRFWQGVTDIPSVNCVRNVFIFNNTIAGTLGDPLANRNSMVNVFYPSYNWLFNSFYGILENVRIFNNIFTWDTEAYPEMRSVNMNFNQLHPGPRDITMGHNIWVRDHEFKGPGDMVRTSLSGSFDPYEMDLSEITPCEENPDWILEVANPFAFLTDDFLYNFRSAGVTNAGALEYVTSCLTGTRGGSKNPLTHLRLYPNPCIACERIKVEGLESGGFKIYDLWGRLVNSGQVQDGSFYPGAGLQGMYVVQIKTADGIRISRLMISK